MAELPGLGDLLLGRYDVSALLGAAAPQATGQALLSLEAQLQLKASTLPQPTLGWTTATASDQSDIYQKVAQSLAAKLEEHRLQQVQVATALQQLQALQQQQELAQLQQQLTALHQQHVPRAANPFQRSRTTDLESLGRTSGYDLAGAYAPVIDFEQQQKQLVALQQAANPTTPLVGLQRIPGVVGQHNLPVRSFSSEHLIAGQRRASPQILPNVAGQLAAMQGLPNNKRPPIRQPSGLGPNNRNGANGAGGGVGRSADGGRRARYAATAKAPSWASEDWHPMKAVLASGAHASGGTGVFLPHLASSNNTAANNNNNASSNNNNNVISSTAAAGNNNNNAAGGGGGGCLVGGQVNGGPGSSTCGSGSASSAASTLNGYGAAASSTSGGSLSSSSSHLKACGPGGSVVPLAAVSPQQSLSARSSGEHSLPGQIRVGAGSGGPPPPPPQPPQAVASAAALQVFANLGAVLAAANAAGGGPPSLAASSVSSGHSPTHSPVSPTHHHMFHGAGQAKPHQYQHGAQQQQQQHINHAQLDSGVSPACSAESNAMYSGPNCCCDLYSHQTTLEFSRTSTHSELESSHPPTSFGYFMDTMKVVVEEPEREEREDGGTEEECDFVTLARELAELMSKQGSITE